MRKLPIEITEELVAKIFELDQRYKKVEDTERKQEGGDHHLRYQEAKQIRMDLMRLLNQIEGMNFNGVERELEIQATKIEDMEKEE